MMETYLTWLARETGSQWNNDSALMAQVENAVKQGAIGITTNPPLSYEALTTETEYYGQRLAEIDRSGSDDEFAMQAMSLVVKRFSEYFMDMHNQMGTYYGCVRAQVAPSLRADAEGMLAAGKQLSKIGKNIMVKIPGTKAGIWVLEELAALGIPTTPTVVTTISQAIAAAEAFERGCARAEKAGITPAFSTCAVVMGRAQDYFTRLNDERNAGLTKNDLDWAALAIVKRAGEVFAKNGYRTRIMPAAFRAAMQVEQLSGGPFCSTIHPKIQKEVADADGAGHMKRELLADAPLDKKAVERVRAALPEFSQAFEPDGLSPDQFDEYGAVKMTLDAFDKDGWQKLISLK